MVLNIKPLPRMRIVRTDDNTIIVADQKEHFSLRFKFQLRVILRK